MAFISKDRILTSVPNGDRIQRYNSSVIIVVLAQPSHALNSNLFIFSIVISLHPSRASACPLFPTTNGDDETRLGRSDGRVDCSGKRGGGWLGSSSRALDASLKDGESCVECDGESSFSSS